MRKDPNRMLSALFLDDGPRNIVQDGDVRALRLERLRWDDEHTPIHFWNHNFPGPLKVANIAFAKSSIGLK